MKLSIDNGSVVCSLENKNGAFLSACSGMFDGFLHGKLKMYYDNPQEFYKPDYVTEDNYLRLKTILRYALRYGVSADSAVTEYFERLSEEVNEIKARRKQAEERELAYRNWERLCKNGCGKCRYLTYFIDEPKCKKTGATLAERNVQDYDENGVLRLFNFKPFPSDECPFNIKNNKENNYERISEACGSKKAT